uniref:Uncharacterized protein n=1 Tax=Arundo donax TaxID=35708 RepID=A0A0A9H863_ARUDO
MAHIKSCLRANRTSISVASKGQYKYHKRHGLREKFERMSK